MTDPYLPPGLIGPEILVFIAMLENGFDHEKREILYSPDVTIKISDREYYVDSKNNNWYIYPDDFSWTAKFNMLVTKFEEIEDATAVEISNLEIEGDADIYENDMLVLKLMSDHIEESLEAGSRLSDY